MTGILIILNIIFFNVAAMAGFGALTALASYLIGFECGCRAARTALLTPGDVKARRMFGLLTYATAFIVLLVSLGLRLSFGQLTWISFVMVPTVGTLLGIYVSYKVNYYTLKSIN